MNKPLKKISVCQPTLTGKEWPYVKDCLDTNWISSNGKYIEKFEKNFSRFCGVKFGISCTSGTTALHLALAAAGIKKGDEVIIPSFTIISVPNAVLWTGAKPVLVDSELATGNIDADKIEEKITKKTKAIIPVHIYGHPCEMGKITALAKKYKLIVIEDCAEAHGAAYKGRKVGSLGDLGCFSFYTNKIITTGEGGMVITNNGKYAQKLRLLKNLAFIKPRFVHQEIGFNYRLTNIAAAIGVAQLEKISQFIAARRKNAKLYNQRLKKINGILPPVEKKYVKNVYWMYAIRLAKNFPLTKDELMDKLASRGIETRSFFYPMHLQPIFKKMGLFKKEKYPISEILYQTGLYLPSASNLTVKEIKKVVAVIETLAKE
ncbi:MAG: hypothetical protein A3J65_04455 [Candidatus Buchananbacteria bacterium RIFCSPHIGHO2_02_FULL_45_11b]|uniref:Aminotransferase DegT n=1 Tax=Candidatus Buchananbacteria bacterium RIFCSPHIGHO2_02_FULL_45_11b TaxID=1797541 RepID=A0A1G1YD29_9BACT|nr:MAG: hypothetical protein A3J65_04455 [Candidatus Buchananbacteria bacterium RIFCSPHIGHO2_02_FULL_45_11b]